MCSRPSSGLSISYRSGQAVFTIDGRDLCLGKHGTSASRKAYQRIVGEWRQGRRLQHDANYPATITELVVAYAVFAAGYYRKDGKPTNEGRMIKSAIKTTRQPYCRASAVKFGQLALKACREKMIEKDWCRSHINKQIDRIRRMFTCATENELFPGTAWLLVVGLIRNRRMGYEFFSLLGTSFGAGRRLYL